MPYVWRRTMCDAAGWIRQEQRCMPSATLLSPPTQSRPLGSAASSGCTMQSFFCRQEGALQPAGVPRAEAAELAAQVAHLERQVSDPSPGTMAEMHSGNMAGPHAPTERQPAHHTGASASASAAVGMRRCCSADGCLLRKLCFCLLLNFVCCRYCMDPTADAPCCPDSWRRGRTRCSS